MGENKDDAQMQEFLIKMKKDIDMYIYRNGAPIGTEEDIEFYQVQQKYFEQIFNKYIHLRKKNSLSELEDSFCECFTKKEELYRGIQFRDKIIPTDGDDRDAESVEEVHINSELGVYRSYCYEWNHYMREKCNRYNDLVIKIKKPTSFGLDVNLFSELLGSSTNASAGENEIVYSMRAKDLANTSLAINIQNKYHIGIGQEKYEDIRKKQV